MPPDISRIPLPTAGRARKKKPVAQGGGRKKGSVNVATMARMARMDGAAAELLKQMSPDERNAMTSVDVLRFAMKAYVAIGDVDRAAKMAAELAPYESPKLQATAYVTEDGLRALGKQQLERLIGLAEKAALTVDGEVG